MVKIELGPYKFKGESGWHECSAKRIAELSVFSRVPEDKRDDHVIATVLKVWLRIPDLVFRKLVVDFYQLYILRKQVEWIFHRPIKKPFEFIRVGNRLTGTRIYLPAPEFIDTTSLELAMSFIHYTEFGQGEQEHLDKLIATLCRPKAKEKPLDTDDIREPFNEYRADKMAEKLGKVPMGVKVAFLNYFEAMLEDFMATYKEVFGSGKESRYDSGLGMIMVLKSVAQQGHFGDYDQVCKKPVNLFWAFLLQDVLDNKENIEKYA